MSNQMVKVLFPTSKVRATIITPLGIINTRNIVDADITIIVPFLKYIKHIFLTVVYKGPVSGIIVAVPVNCS